MNRNPDNSSLEQLTIDATASTNQLVENSGGWWSTLSPKWKRSILIGAPLSVIIVPLVILLTVTLSVSQKCQFYDQEPLLGAPVAVSTQSDAKNLIKLSGFIRVHELGYLPLNVERMQFNPVDNSLNLHDSCVKLTIYYNPNITDNVRVMSIKWTLEGDPERMDQPYWLCHPDKPKFTLEFPAASHYSCHDRRTYECQHKDDDGQMRTVGELVVKWLELEIDGNSSMIRQGKFSKPAFRCGV